MRCFTHKEMRLFLFSSSSNNYNKNNSPTPFTLPWKQAKWIPLLLGRRNTLTWHDISPWINLLKICWNIYSRIFYSHDAKFAMNILNLILVNIKTTIYHTFFHTNMMIYIMYGKFVEIYIYVFFTHIMPNSIRNSWMF